MPGNGDIFKKVQAGDKLQPDHQAWNTLMDMAQAFKGAHRNQSANAPLPALESGHCYIQNATGAALDRFAVVGLDVPIILPTDNLDTFHAHVAFSGVTPLATTHVGKFAILLEPAAANSVALAVVSGVVPVMLDVIGAGDHFADIHDGTSADLKTSPAPGTASAQILWKESGTGTGIRAIVRLGNAARFLRWGKVYSVWSAGTNTIVVTPTDAAGVVTGGPNDTVYVDLPIQYAAPAVAQYCAYAVNDVVPYFDVKGDGTTFALLRNKLPQMTAQYHVWLNNSSSAGSPNVVADYPRAG